MARALRIEYNGAFYHVTARGNERKRIFFAKADYKKFTDEPVAHRIRRVVQQEIPPARSVICGGV